MRDEDLRASIRQADWPEPSPDLRARVLRDAALTKRTVARTDRIWFSRGWRISLTAATVGAALLVYMSGPRTPFDRPTPGERARFTVVEETMRDAGLPADEAAIFARRTAAGSWPHASAMSPSALQMLETFDTIGGRR
jgi:hypothetical protein